MRHCLLLLEDIAYLIAIKDEQQIRMTNQAANFGHLSVVYMQLVHNLVQVANFVGSCRLSVIEKPEFNKEVTKEDIPIRGAKRQELPIRGRGYGPGTSE